MNSDQNQKKPVGLIYFTDQTPTKKVGVCIFEPVKLHRPLDACCALVVVYDGNSYSHVHATPGAMEMILTNFVNKSLFCKNGFGSLLNCENCEEQSC